MIVKLLNKEDITSVSSHEKAMWFDIYNNDLFQDRGYDIKKMDIEDIEKVYLDIKLDYYNYFMNLHTLDTFCYYVILVDEYQKFVSQARVMKFNEKYTIEGLETHRDCLQKGYAKECIKSLEEEASKRGIKTLYANIFEENIPSIKTFLALGYEISDDSKGKTIIVSKTL